MNVYSKFGLNILTMKDLRQFFLPPVKFQKVQIVPSGSNTSIYIYTVPSNQRLKPNGLVRIVASLNDHFSIPMGKN